MAATGGDGVTGLAQTVSERETLQGAHPSSRALSAAITGLVQEVFDQLISRGVRGLAICGVAEGDGVSFVAARLATALARSGVTTLLIDANLRAPGQRAHFPDAVEPTLGLIDLVSRPGVDPEAVIVPNVRPGLSVVFGGAPIPGVDDALSQSAFAGFVERCLRTFEFVVFDTPPANQTPDALRIARLAGYALLVVRRDQTFVSDLNHFIEELRDQGATIIGSLLNEG
ncbi:MULTISPECIES: CpsD/CapB family tyrosine-protein kinase [unclassified Phenylobacterium]|uniref:CpsD/CapB family tyrosine-protein kinase n=1 Tax=unclassified Phenylobacterium TaxID=2640670 RepID=UPI00083ACBE4|nr:MULTISPECIES: CpsD/CapB family tyrosine-protein kinase [unclassified Phenylobacterium]